MTSDRSGAASASLVSPAMRDRVRGFATPVARGLGRMGLTPNALTVIGFLGTCIAAFAAANQWWLAAGVMVLTFGIFDLFDGTLARATGRATKLGAFLDSTFDRAGEAIVYLGIAAGCLAVRFDAGVLLAAGAMAAAFMVSYTRAKAEGLGFAPGTGMANVGIAPREVRLVVLSVGLIAGGLGGVIDPFFVCPNPGDTLADCWSSGLTGGTLGLGLSLGLITVGATLTTIQRTLHVRAQSREG